MREIKFRAWDKELKFFTSTSQYFVEFDGSAWFNLGTADHQDYLVDQSSKLVLMQYTGLKDKNGKEIYSGDLLAFESAEWRRNPAKDDYIFQVEQSETGEWVGAGICTECATYCEIIGNIHENPELLEKDNNNG